MIARLTRIIPLLIVLAVVAAIVYLVVMFRHSPQRAKEVIITLFTWITGILSAFFLAATAYALFERNAGVADLAGSFLATSLIALVVVRVCRAVFLRHHPEYREKPMKAKPVGRFPWDRKK